jgi:hypothetical protein
MLLDPSVFGVVMAKLSMLNPRIFRGGSKLQGSATAMRVATGETPSFGLIVTILERRVVPRIQRRTLCFLDKT